MPKKLRSFALVGTAAVLLAATACAPRGGTVSDNDAATESGYPDRKIEMLVAFAPGGAVDTAARLIAPVLERELGVTVEVTNVPGAGGQTGYTQLASAEPDGYTIGSTGSPSVVVAPLDPARGATFTIDSFQPLAMQVIDPAVVAVSPSSEYDSLEDLFAAAQADPGTINATTTGLQGGEHFMLAQVGDLFGAEFNPVHFSEGQSAAVTAFLGGHVDVYVGNVSDVTDLVEQGTAKVLGVAAEERHSALEDVPTFAEEGFDFAAGTVRGYSAPAGLPDDVKERLDEAFGVAINDPEVLENMENLGLTTEYQDADGYTGVWQEQDELYRSVLDLVLGEQ
jgi:tripartite-type tricarboxylate transporter receptor subunit TctC